MVLLSRASLHSAIKMMTRLKINEEINYTNSSHLFITFRKSITIPIYCNDSFTHTADPVANLVAFSSFHQPARKMNYELKVVAK
jgi:hypothetical protein